MKDLFKKFKDVNIYLYAKLHNELGPVISQKQQEKISSKQFQQMVFQIYENIKKKTSKEKML